MNYFGERKNNGKLKRHFPAACSTVEQEVPKSVQQIKPLVCLDNGRPVVPCRTCVCEDARTDDNTRPSPHSFSQKHTHAHDVQPKFEIQSLTR